MPKIEKTDSNLDSNTFTQLGKPFQEKVMQALIIDKRWAMSFIEVFNVDECFDYAPLRVLANTYINYFKRYKEFPSLELLKSIIRDEYSNNSDLVLREKMTAIVAKMEKNDNLSDLPWVKEKAFTFCRQQLLKTALIKSSEIIATEKYETVVDLMKTALAAGIATNSGHDYNHDIDARYSETYRNPVSTGIPQLDERKIMNGGLGMGEIGIVVAPTGVGKSHMLVHFGAAAVLAGKNVFYYSMELSERLIGIRFDSHMIDVPSTECPEQVDLIKEFFDKNSATLGRLYLKEYPTRTITANTIRAHVEKMSYTNIRPDLIIVDYAGIIRSTEKYELPRLEMQCVIQELRKLAQELMIPVWTALQSNKEGAKSEIIDVTNMAESYGQASEADFVLGLQRQSTQKSTGYGTLFIAKSRLGIDGVQYQIHLDTSRSKLRILSDAEKEQLSNTAEEIKSDTLSSFRNSIAKRKNMFRKPGDNE